MLGNDRDPVSASAGRQMGINAILRRLCMKKIMRLALVTTVLPLAMSTTTAQSTNVVQRANFVLKGTTQTSSGVTSVRLVNKDILAALNATGEYQFGPKATLLFVSTDDQPPVLIVSEANRGQASNTDISDYFDVTEVGDKVRSANDKTRWETWNFAFDNGNTNETAFELWGATTIHRGAIRTRGVGTLAGPQRVQSDVRGVGRVEGAITIFSGRVDGTNPNLTMSEP
jgi:hypothetical protein